MLGELPGDQLAGSGHQVLLAGLLLELHLEQVAEVLLGGELEAGLHVGGLFMTFLPDETSRRLMCDLENMIKICYILRVNLTRTSYATFRERMYRELRLYNCGSIIMFTTINKGNI
jgi:hypothetical protein